MIAEQYVTTGELTGLQLEADSYRTVYGDPVLVVSTRGIADYSAGMNVDERVADAIARGLRNERSTDLDRLTPFRSDPVLFVRPVGTGAQVNGAVVIEASTLDARGDILRGWLVIAAGFVLAMAMFVALSLALGRWVLSPLSSLASSMREFETKLPFRGDDSPSASGSRPRSIDNGGGPPEIRSLARTFGSLMDSVVGAVDSQERLVAETAHQLRNPLTALQFRIDMLSADVPDRLSDDMRIIGAEAERLHVILDELLSYASAHTPALPGGGVAEDCGVNAVLLDRVDFWSLVVRERGAQIEIGSEPDHETRVRIRESDLTQILDVLFDNATKHAGDGVRIVAGVAILPPRRGLDDREPSRILVTVEDTGVGVEADALGSLTDPFVSTGHGAGLGLSIVAALIRRANGDIRFDRSPLGGLRVQITLPRSPQGLSSAPARSAEYLGATVADPASDRP
ncbi:HAMP domain-containing sensor histidine kinase [Rhodococcus sp. B10]|uniref:ATP-binding protein n=1 Tax=Rhodococcus sp. B10 TaxID=2695876 RepID=UPI0014314AB9